MKKKNFQDFYGLVHICKVQSSANFLELDTKNPFIDLFQSVVKSAGEYVPQIDIDVTGKILRFMLPCGLASYECVNKLCSGILNVASDATFDWIGLGIENPDFKMKLPIDVQKFTEGQQVIIRYTKPLPGNQIAPPVFVGDTYITKRVVNDSQGNQHVDLGIISRHNYVNSYETKEPLPNSDKIHWVHPSRLELV